MSCQIGKINKTIFSLNETNMLKGFGILLVVISHVGNNFTRLTTPLGGIGVAIFLILSGYGLTISCEKNQLKDFWKKRITGVWIPYVIVESFVLIFSGGISLEKFILDITLIEPQYCFGWYLNYLLIWYTIFWGITN